MHELSATQFEAHVTNLYFKKIIKENHKCAVERVIASKHERCANVLATIGGNQVNFYDNDHCEGHHFDLMSHFVSTDTPCMKASVSYKEFGQTLFLIIT